jgi:fatty acid desaturase
LLSLGEYKRSHMRHHARLGCSDDPDLIRLKELGLHPLPAQVSLGKLLAGLPRFYIRYLVGSLYLADKLSLAKRIGAPAVIVAALNAAVGVRAMEIVILYWLVPFLTSYQAIKFIAETGEHTGLYQRLSHECDVRFKSIHMTRNTLVGALPAFLLYPYGDNFHMLHHRYPCVPGFNLPSLHAQLLAQNWYSKVGYPDNCPLWGEGSLLNLLLR